MALSKEFVCSFCVVAGEALEQIHIRIQIATIMGIFNYSTFREKVNKISKKLKKINLLFPRSRNCAIIPSVNKGRIPLFTEGSSGSKDKSDQEDD